MRKVHPLLQAARGLCADGAPHEEIEALLAQAVDVAKDLEERVAPFPRGVQTHQTPRRPGGRQTSFERTVRIVAWALLDEGYVGTERAAERKARKWLGRALPAKQRLPRKQPADLREAA